MALLSLLLLFSVADASRIRLASLSDLAITPPLRFAERFCMAKDLKMACEENSEMTVYSAFYNRRFDKNCPAVERPAGGAESCAANFTERLLRCNGERECVLPASEHSYCAEKPYQGIRAVWSCSPSRKRAEPEELPAPELEPLEEEDEEEELLEYPKSLPDEDRMLVSMAVDEEDDIPAVDEDQDIRYAKKFCTGEDLVLACEDSWRVEPFSAFYNSRQAQGCKAAEAPDCSVRECSCAPNATELLLSHCPKGSQRCELPASVHRFCSKRSFNFMRVVWDCVKDGERVRSVAKHQVA